jgi:hypothetical protein
LIIDIGVDTVTVVTLMLVKRVALSCDSIVIFIPARSMVTPTENRTPISTMTLPAVKLRTCTPLYPFIELKSGSIVSSTLLARLWNSGVDLFAYASM